MGEHTRPYARAENPRPWPCQCYRRSLPFQVKASTWQQKQILRIVQRLPSELLPYILQRADIRQQPRFRANRHFDFSQRALLSPGGCLPVSVRAAAWGAVFHEGSARFSGPSQQRVLHEVPQLCQRPQCVSLSAQAHLAASVSQFGLVSPVELAQSNVQAYGWTNFYSRPDIVLWSKNWLSK